jgi:hypothetical protein
MRMITFMMVWGVAVMITPITTHAEVKVSFNQPERYTDAGLHGAYGPKARAATLHELQKHLERLGERYLKPEQMLTIDVRDIDLAGRYEPWRINTHNTRILREITWPQIRIYYTLKSNNTVLVSAEETISDLNYLMRADTIRSSDPLRYEKAMLDEWFRVRFVDRQPA